MPNVYEDSPLAEARRREAIFAGDIFRFRPTRSWIALSDFARSVIQKHFGNLDPLRAQHELSVEQFVAIVGPLKSDFTNHQQTKELVRDVLVENGYDLDTTAFDVPRLRVVSSDGFLSAGVGYAYKAHRDTWYAAPQSQINWWAPLHDLEVSQSLIFYPSFFDQVCQNTSESFDYADWQAHGRTAATTQVKQDTRNHPLPMTQLAARDELRLVTPADHRLQFSAAQLHGTAANTSGLTRFSIDFRSIDMNDYRQNRGAANVDSKSKNSTIVDFLDAKNFTPVVSGLQEVEI